MTYDINTIRDIIGDKLIVDSLIQYLSGDSLRDFCETLVTDHEIEYFDHTITDIYDWYHSLHRSEQREVDDVMVERCGYTAEKKWLSKDDLVICINYNKIKSNLEDIYEIDIQDDDFKDFCETILTNVFDKNPNRFAED